MEPETPFYSLSPEDKLIKCAKKAGFVSAEVRVTERLNEQCASFSFRLDARCMARALAILNESFHVKDRFPLHIEVSMEEICLHVHEISKILFVGGGAVEVAKPLLIDFFEHCGLNAILTSLFKAKLCNKSNDYDFQFITSHPKAVDEGIVELLTSKIKWDLINCAQLKEELNSIRKKAERIPYLKQVFANTEDLGMLAVKVFSFVKANDVAGQFFFRNIASKGNSYDCFIPVGDQPKINSFCIDISDTTQELYLECLQGKEMLLQAIIDANFAILYSDPNHPANDLDFARTICHLSKRGRLTGTGWLQKAFYALDGASIKRNWRISTLLLQQLVNRSESHHRLPQDALIVLAFNASAILMTLDPSLENEVQALWEELGNHFIKGGKGGPQDPLLKQIKFLLCDSFCSFQDVLAQIQVSSLLKQHGKSGVYPCIPTQSEDSLFTQIVINFTPDLDDDTNVNICTLMFPFGLLNSINKVKNLNLLHDILCTGSDLTVGINQSVLKKEKYRSDARRKFPEGVQEALILLNSKKEHVWKMGFLLSLSHLSMAEDRALFKTLIESVILMLLKSWPSAEFKHEIAIHIQAVLKNSQIYTRKGFFQAPTPNSIIGDLISSDHAIMQNLGWSYFKKVENKPHEKLEELYFDLGNSNEECNFFKMLLKYMAGSTQLSAGSALKMCQILFNKIESLHGIEEVLLETILSSVQKIKKDLQPEFLLTILQSKVCEQYPYLGLMLAWEAYRLKIYSDRAEVLHGLVIQSEVVHSSYYTEKFDVLSDFMKYYALTSIHALKASILRRMKLKDSFLHLLILLDKSNDAWGERDFIMEVARELPKNELKHVIDFLLMSVKNRSNSEQVQFYCEQLQNEELLDPLLMLMNDETTDQDLIRCIENLLKINEKKGLTVSHRKEISERLVKQLYNRSLWKELESIFLAKPSIFLEWTPSLLSIFIHAYQHFEGGELLLKSIPLDFELSSEVIDTLRLHLCKLQDKSFKQERFIDTLEWAKKWKVIEEPNVFDNAWTKLVPELLRASQKEQPELHALVVQVFDWLRPAPSVWSEYIKHATVRAPLDVVEKIVDLLPGLEQPFNIQDALLERLEEFKSMKFLEPASWWLPLWKERVDESVDVKREFVYQLIKGAAISNDQICTKNVMEVLELKEITSFLSFNETQFSCALRLGFAKLSWFSGSAELRSKALSTLLDVLTMMGHSLLIEYGAVSLLNQFLKTIPAHKSLEDIRLILLLVQRIQEISSFDKVDHVAILRTLKDLIKIQTYSQEMTGCIINSISENVKASINRSVTQSADKKLIKWGINRVHESELIIGYDLVVWCLDNPHIAQYLDKKDLERFEFYKDTLRGGCSVIISLMHLWEEAHKCKDAVLSPMRRCAYLQRQGLKEHFFIQPGEVRALENAGLNTLHAFRIALRVVAVALFSFALYTYTQRKNC